MAMDDRTRRSRIYQEALKIALDYIRNPEKIDGLLKRSSAKADQRKGRLDEAWGQIQLLVAMLRSYRAGEYREMSQKTLLLIIAALLYFVIPADLIPDILLGLGYIDDIALLAWTVKSVSDELERFDQWRKIQASPMGAARAEAAQNRPGITIEGELASE